MESFFWKISRIRPKFESSADLDHTKQSCTPESAHSRFNAANTSSLNGSVSSILATTSMANLASGYKNGKVLNFVPNRIRKFINFSFVKVDTSPSWLPEFQKSSKSSYSREGEAIRSAVAQFSQKPEDHLHCPCKSPPCSVKNIP
uniref:Uncharacterized protein n=1 Tax=Romanomermis culicivorax TaxID=13658 RepID=A0A915HRI9_ROMCU